jgi:protein-S-isoprenylcysteine O-methyltransferase Ste14
VPVGFGALEPRGSGTQLRVQFRWGSVSSWVLSLLLVLCAGVAALVAGRAPMPELAVAVLIGVPIAAWWHFAWGMRRILRGLSGALGGVTWQRAGVTSASGAA